MMEGEEMKGEIAITKEKVVVRVSSAGWSTTERGRAGREVGAEKCTTALEE